MARKGNKAKNEPSKMGKGGRDEDTLYPAVLAPAFVSAFFLSLSNCIRVLYAFVIYAEKPFLVVSLMSST